MAAMLPDGLPIHILGVEIVARPRIRLEVGPERVDRHAVGQAVPESLQPVCGISEFLAKLFDLLRQRHRLHYNENPQGDSNGSCNESKVGPKATEYYGALGPRPRRGLPYLNGHQPPQAAQPGLVRATHV